MKGIYFHGTLFQELWNSKFAYLVDVSLIPSRHFEVWAIWSFSAFGCSQIGYLEGLTGG